MIKVLIADDHTMVIDGLTMLLSEVENIQVVGKAANGLEALKILEEQEVDIAILDVEMPKLNGIETAEQISEKHPHIRVLILSMYNDQSFIKKLIEIGAYGYILKNKGKEELVDAINSIIDGKKYYGREVVDTLISQIEKGKEKKADNIQLTDREIDVLELIAMGHSTPQIAQKLFIAPSTVETHRRHLIEKTGVPNSKGLIRWAIEKGY